MPGLTNIDPQGELVRRIMALEGELRRVATVRRDPQQGLRAAKSLGGSSQVVGAATDTKVTFDDEIYSNPPGTWDTATALWTPPSDGVYAVTAILEYEAGGANTFHMGFATLVGGGSPGNRVTRAVNNGHTVELSLVYPVRTGTTWCLWANITGGGTVGHLNSALTIQRLGDLPEYTV